jgi:2-polyprenyl-3-methyl-5-hydroxy-6-metoxy-1,4-benzoquinol methylase
VSICIRRFADLTPETISALQQRLVEYYSHPPESYYTIADQAAANYRPEIQPFHCDLVNRVRPGMSVLELGCGSAHLCPFVEAAGGQYTGMDYSAQLLKNNRTRFPRASFISIGEELLKGFDIVASLYTIEHVVDPIAYLETMWGFCKAGGLLAIICPDFVDGSGFAPSFYYGTRARRLREKLRSLNFIDALKHLLDLFCIAPLCIAQARRSQPGAFWINLKPRILAGAAYSVDADAVHLSRLKDLVWWLEKHGATVIATSRSLAGIAPSILRYNCYVVARKPQL